MDFDTGADDNAHTAILQAVICHLLGTNDLCDICDDAGIPALIGQDGTPVHITAVGSYADEGVLSTDHGVVIAMSDGSRFACPISVQALPEQGFSLRDPTP